MTSEQLAAIERLRELKNSDEHWDDDKVQAAFDEAMPLIEALQKALSEAQADARVFSGSYNALAEDFGRLKEENERLRESDKFLSALMAAGVDCWDGYEAAIEIMEALHDS